VEDRNECTSARRRRSRLRRGIGLGVELYAEETEPVRGAGPDLGRVLADPAMPGAQWFTGAQLNYAEHLIGRDEDLDEVAVVAQSQTRARRELTFRDLRASVARARAGLQRLGVGPGDRVVAYLPNIPETLVAFIATASLGAVWAACAPEFGARRVVARFAQIEPTVLLCVGGYGFRNRYVDRRAEVETIRSQMPTVEHVVWVPYGEAEIPDAVSWDELVSQDGPLEFDPVPFDHPLYVLFSSGTTGLPKAIVHGHGGQLHRPGRRPAAPGPRTGAARSRTAGAPAQ